MCPPPLTSVRKIAAHNCRSGHRRVTFSLPDSEWAGGFGDRLLGLATTYYVAATTAAALDVNWTRPYNLRDYFHVLDCAYLKKAAQAGKETGRLSIDAERLAMDALHLPPQPATTLTIPAVDRWSYFENGHFLKDLNRDVNIMTNGRHWVDVVATPALANRAQALGIASLSRKQLFGLAVDALLAPRRNVVLAAAAVLAKLGASTSSLPFYVGVQIRCGSHGSLTWNDPTRHSLADMPCFVAEALAACGRRNPCPIFLTADSRTAADAFRVELVKQQGSRSTRVVEAEGPILHTDRTNASTAATLGMPDPWLRSIVDWWLLKHASTLVISRSGFGETAAWASATGAPARRIELGQVESRSTCNVTSFDAASVF